VVWSILFVRVLGVGAGNDGAEGAEAGGRKVRGGGELEWQFFCPHFLARFPFLSQLFAVVVSVDSTADFSPFGIRLSPVRGSFGPWASHSKGLAFSCICVSCSFSTAASMLFAPLHWVGARSSSTAVGLQAYFLISPNSVT
jgi:hypothetical protein